MTQRERNMATVLGIALGGGVVLYGGYWFYNAFFGSGAMIADLTAKVADDEAKIVKAKNDARALQQYRRLSLPNDLNLATRMYREELRGLLYKHDVIDLDFPDVQNISKSTSTRAGVDPLTNKPGKVPLWSGVNYVVRFKTRLPKLLAFIRDFQEAPRMHRIRSWTAERADEKKEGDLLAVQMNFEALSILDAEQTQKKVGENDVPGWKSATMVDTVAALRGLPSGLGYVGWAAGPKGPEVAPLNPPLTAMRKYADIALRNFFLGFSDVKGENADMGEVPPDDTINMMRFNRFISLTNDEGKVEAWLWDASTNQKKRLRMSPGFDRFPLVQNGDLTAVVNGVVVKIDMSEMIFRVALKASFASSSKWWRYPTGNRFYQLHPDDVGALVSAGKAKESDASNLYLVNRSYWDKLKEKGKEKIEVYSDEKNFRVLREFTSGEVLTSDGSVLIVRMNGLPPSAPQPPSVGVNRMYAEEKALYFIQTKHFGELLNSKTSKKLKSEDIDRVYVARTPYWDYLAHQKVLFPDSGKGTFHFYGDLVKGDIISRDDELVVFRLAEKYCHCPGDWDLGIQERWHEGFCTLKIDRMAQEALMAPLSEAKVKELLKPTAGAPGQ